MRIQGVAPIVVATVLIPLSLSILQFAPGSVVAKDQHLAEEPLRADFNGDGFSDLAVGAPGEHVDHLHSAGAVHGLYGSSVGLSPSGNQLWTQNSPLIIDFAEEDDQFGSALAAADFNGDGFTDLAIGVRGESLGPIQYAGAVNVIYGSHRGLTPRGNQIWHQDRAGIEDDPEEWEFFGDSLAGADFNRDGYRDLVIGVPLEDLGTADWAGAAHILYGTPSGLSSANSQFWNQDSPGIEDVPESADLFGADLAIGDFNGDRYRDLAIGVFGESIGEVENAGVVHILHGGPGRLSAAGSQLWSQNSDGIEDTAETNDSFGSALSGGDYNGDRFTDLAIGVLGESVGGVETAGAVNVLYGSAGGLSAFGNQFWHQDSPGILDKAEYADEYGLTLTSGDFNGDGYKDLVVGIPLETVNNGQFEVGTAGAVNVLYGMRTGLSALGNQFWTQDNPGVEEVMEYGDQFGWGLAGGGDFNGDGFGDLSVGVPFEDVHVGDQHKREAGGAHVFYGSGVGLGEKGNQFWTPAREDIKGKAGRRSFFGLVLSAL